MPMLMHPRPMADTSGPLRPSLRCFISEVLVDQARESSAAMSRSYVGEEAEVTPSLEGRSPLLTGYPVYWTVRPLWQMTLITLLHPTSIGGSPRECATCAPSW